MSGRKTWWTTTTPAPCSTPTRTASLGAGGERVGVDERARPQLVDVEVGVAELQQRGAELVLAGVAVLLDEAVRLQRLQQPVDGGRGEPEAVGELGHAEPPGPARERLEDARGAVDGLDRAPRPPRIVMSSRVFGIVESASIM